MITLTQSHKMPVILRTINKALGYEKYSMRFDYTNTVLEVLEHEKGKQVYTICITMQRRNWRAKARFKRALIEKYAHLVTVGVLS